MSLPNVPIFRVLSAHFGRNLAKNQRQISCANTLFLVFSELLVFREENHEIRDRFKVKTFFRDHFLLGTKIIKSETDSK